MSKCMVLIVDDEEDFLENMVKRMAMRNPHVYGVKSGIAALDYLEKEPVDVVLLDVKMPGMDGIETLEAIKKHHPETEVIMLTGHADVEAAMRGISLGAFDYLMKPAELSEVLFKVQKAYEKKNL